MTDRSETVGKQFTDFEDFCHLSDDKAARLSSVERLTLQGGEELEKFFSRITTDAVPLNFAPLIAGLSNEALRSTAAFYSTIKEPFISPKGVFAPKVIPVHGLSADGEIVDIEFESSYQPIHSSNKKIHVAIPENKTVRVRLWKHTHNENRPTMIAVPGWTMGDQKINALTFMPGFFFRLGFNVAIFELPFHGRRLTSEFRDIGHSVFPSANLFLTNEAILQGVSDLRQLKLILRALGLKKFGAFGISLGSYLTTLWSTIEPLSFIVNLLPFFDMSTVTEAALKREANTEIDPSLLRQALSVHSPIGRVSKTDSKDVQMITMASDSVIPVEDIKEGRKLFPEAEFIVLLGDHEVHSSRESIVDRMTAHLKKYL